MSTYSFSLGGDRTKRYVTPVFHHIYVTNFLKKFVHFGYSDIIKRLTLWVLSHLQNPFFIKKNLFVFFCASVAPSLHSTPV